MCLQLFISFILAFHHLEATYGCSRSDSKELDGCLHVQLQQLSQTVRQIQRTTAFTTQGQYLFSAHYIVCLPFIAQLWHDMSSVELLYSWDFNWHNCHHHRGAFYLENNWLYCGTELTHFVIRLKSGWAFTFKHVNQTQSTLELNLTLAESLALLCSIYV